MAVKFSNLTQIDKDVDNIKTNMGNIKDINTIGDGTVSGAIKELHNTSTKGIRITQEEYDKLTDEQKQGVYFIIDATDEASDFAEKFHEYASTITDIANKVGDEDLSNIGSISSALSKLDGVITNSDKLVYGEKYNEVEDIELQVDADLLGGELPSYYASKYDVSDINTKLDKLSNTVKNINRGKVFGTEIEMKVWLKNGNNKHQLTVGDSLFIKEKNKPDYWVSAVYDNADSVTGMFYEVTEMESEKVDLSDYDTKIGNVDIDGIGNGSITGAIYFLENERAKLFQSVSDGKKAVANAITGKGVPTAEDAQFATLVNNINSIKNTPRLQAKTVSVGASSITVTPDIGYDGLSTVTAKVVGQEKTLTVKFGSCIVVPDNGRVLTKVNINGPTNQGIWNSTLDSNNIEVTIPEGYHDGNGKISIKPQIKTVTHNYGSLTVKPDSGKVLSSVIINGPTDYAMENRECGGCSIDGDIDNPWVNLYIPFDGYYSTSSSIFIKANDIINDLVDYGYDMGQSSLSLFTHDFSKISISSEAINVIKSINVKSELPGVYNKLSLMNFAFTNTTATQNGTWNFDSYDAVTGILLVKYQRTDISSNDDDCAIVRCFYTK